MENKSLGVYVRSYKRHDKILTENLLENCVYVVRKSEESDYFKAGVNKIWAIDDELIDSGVKCFWYIIENAKEDVLCILDDDIEDMMYRLDLNTPLNKDKELISSEIERIAQLLVDLDIGFATIDATGVPYGYDGEFAFKGTAGAIKWINKSKFKAKPDDKVRYNFDLDIVLQELLTNRIILKPRYLVANAVIDKNNGGGSSKLRKNMIESIYNMKHKWGKYFDYGLKHNKPVIKVKR
jgi:hypothetical protein